MRPQFIHSSFTEVIWPLIFFEQFSSVQIKCQTRAGPGSNGRTFRELTQLGRNALRVNSMCLNESYYSYSFFDDVILEAFI